jgi:hypothetical protein
MRLTEAIDRPSCRYWTEMKVCIKTEYAHAGEIQLPVILMMPKTRTYTCASEKHQVIK